MTIDQAPSSRVIDRSTFSDPMVPPTGIEKVFVGGELVWDTGNAAGGRAGQVITSADRF